MSEKLLAGYRRFRSGYFAQNQERLRSIAQGHNPSYILITCCDARLDPSLIFDTEPGELFVIRNVANLVPPCEHDSAYHGTSAALEFAVTVLEVPEVVVLGHSSCGGIRALVTQKDRMPKDSFIARWMSIVEPVAELADPDKLDEPETFTCCEQEAIRYSLENLKTYPWIRERVEDGRLRLHGWHYSIEDGSLAQL